jgi:hypothetical protein
MCFMAIPAALASIGSTIASAATAAGTAISGAAATAGAAVSGMASAAGAATTAATGLTGMQALQLGMSAASGINSFLGSQAQASAAEQVARNNQIMAGYAAADAQRRGEEDAQAVQRRAAQLRGTQRSMMAARGLDLSVGTPAELIDQTDFFGEQDAATARMNARRESWAIRADAANQSAAASAEASRLRSSGFTSLLGSAMSVADKWTSFRKPPTGGFNTNASGMMFSPTGAAIRARR